MTRETANNGAETMFVPHSGPWDREGSAADCGAVWQLVRQDGSYLQNEEYADLANQWRERVVPGIAER